MRGYFTTMALQNSGRVITCATTMALDPLRFLTNPLEKQLTLHYYATQWNKGIGTKGNEAV
jgi:hypothetical protein